MLAHRFAKFDPERAFAMLAKHRVGVSFIPPTALKMMRQVNKPRERWDYDIRAISTGGEAMGEELLAWGRDTFGTTISEGYGQTEMNLMLLNSPDWFEVRPGSCGRACPGRKVAIVDSQGNLLPPGEEGQIAGWRHDPIVMLEYWRNPEATARKFAGDWLLTGDLGRIDEDGYVFFKSRDDDVITSGGYRIGPGEIEECLMKHPAVAMVGVVGVPDKVRTEIVKAFVQLRPEIAPSDGVEGRSGGLREDPPRRPRISARGRVRGRAAAHHDRQDPAPRAAPARRRNGKPNVLTLIEESLRSCRQMSAIKFAATARPSQSSARPCAFALNPPAHSALNSRVLSLNTSVTRATSSLPNVWTW